MSRVAWRVERARREWEMCQWSERAWREVRATTVSDGWRGRGSEEEEEEEDEEE